jgi:hypothetical protein
MASEPETPGRLTAPKTPERHLELIDAGLSAD